MNTHPIKTMQEPWFNTLCQVLYTETYVFFKVKISHINIY